MAMRYLTLADVKDRFSEVTTEVVTTHERVVVTKHGKPAVVLMAVDDLEGLEETLEILSDPALATRLAESKTEVGEELTKEQALGRWGRGD